MAIYLQDIVDINLNGGMIHRNFKSVAIGSGDENANQFGMRVHRDGVPEDLTGVSCQAVFQDPMGNNIALTSHGHVDGNEAYVTLPQACYNYEGRFCLAIKLIGGGVTGTMRIVDGVVNNTHTGGAVAPTGAVPTYQEVLAVYDDAISAVAEVNIMRSMIRDVEDVLEMEFQSGYYENATVGSTVSGITSSSSYVCAKAACAPGQDVHVNLFGRRNIGAAAWAYLDANNKVLLAATSNEYTNTEICKAPAGTAYITVNNRIQQDYKPTGYYARVGKYTKDRIEDNSSADTARENSLMAREIFDFTLFGTESFPYGWRKGYFSLSTGEALSSDMYIRTVGRIMPDNEVKMIRAKAPSGYCIAVCEYNSTNAFVRAYGDMNRLNGTTATKEVIFNHTKGHNYTVVVGRFDDSDAADYAASEVFTESIICEIFKNGIQNEINQLTNLMPTAGIGESVSLTANKYWNTEGSTAVLTNYTGSYYASNQIEVEEGEKYHLQFYAGTSSKQNPVIITDESLNILMVSERPQQSNTIVTEDIEIPLNAKYMLVNTYGNPGGVFQKVVLTKAAGEYFLLNGKTVAIIGDSISTNGNTGEDANVPEITVQAEDVGVPLSAYLTYYDVQAGLSLGGHTFTSSEIGTEVTFTPTAEDIGKSIGVPNNYNDNNVTTWWEILQSKLGNKTIPVCWSGASITSHEANTSNKKTAHAWHPAQIRKCGKRIPGSMTRTAPDIIIIYRGTNDFSHTPYTLLTDGYFDNYNWTYPETDEVTGGYGYKEGLCLTVKKLREAYPNATIFLCTLNVFKRVNYSHFPTNNGINSLPQMNDAIREVAGFLGCGVIEFDKDGITFENCYSGGYITDSSTTPTHPSSKGHAVMGQKAIADIEAQYSPLNV